MVKPIVARGGTFPGLPFKVLLLEDVVPEPVEPQFVLFLLRCQESGFVQVLDIAHRKRLDGVGDKPDKIPHNLLSGSSLQLVKTSGLDERNHSHVSELILRSVGLVALHLLIEVPH